MLGTRIIWAREQRGFKQLYVAVSAGLQPARYNRIENKPIRPYWSEIIRIAGVLRCRLEWLAKEGPIGTAALLEAFPPDDQPGPVYPTRPADHKKRKPSNGSREDREGSPSGPG